MHTQAMGSEGGEPNLQNLATQTSLYNLTLDEVQNQLGNLGKPLGSMNLDELLKSVCSAEVNQSTPLADDNVGITYTASGSALSRQGSLALSRDLSRKTVDEVWRDIQKSKNKNDQERRCQERQLTFGGMTLEDFLLKAGVVSEPTHVHVLGVESVIFSQPNIPHHPHWNQYQLPSLQQQQQQQHQQDVMALVPGQPTQHPLPVGVNPDAAYPETQVTISPSSLMGTLSDTQAQAPGRKRVASEDVAEKNVERKQKRMIKNRESAARSRARKQAYTHELENKVSRLEEENERLRRQKVVDKQG
ncbi:ABSCISIC ACID-INSENSITIVE 5-like protein 2 isoform X2 [Carica papaya]|uniref:ABSCISIC ACID-INSENSITIVE 5-like protein 2 isoform X2 n=1 Tax=Carica papaya TaxID=3649 RepID=UPI000B8CA8E9|nr:ABSCISIC ACID-INSENSITIVE 5-like protein 2 isoform X2 [Carica papaya]